MSQLRIPGCLRFNRWRSRWVLKKEDFCYTSVVSLLRCDPGDDRSGLSGIPNRRVRRAAVGLYPLDVVVLVDPDGDRSWPFECRINCEEIADINIDHGEIGDVLTIGFVHLQAELGALRNST